MKTSARNSQNLGKSSTFGVGQSRDAAPIGVSVIFGGRISPSGAKDASNIIGERILGFPQEHAADCDVPSTQVKRTRD